MLVLLARAPVAQQPQRVRELRVARRHQAALAERAEVLGRVEAEAAERAEPAGGRAAIARAVRLRGVLDHHEAVPLGQRTERIHVRDLAVEWTGRMARVRGVSAFAAASGSRLRVAKSMSAKTGFAPA